MSRLLYIDSFSVKSFHETFNSASLVMMAEIFDEVVFFTSKSSARNMQGILKQFPNNVKCVNIPVLALKGSWGNFLHYFLSNILNVILLLTAKTRDVVFYNYNSIWFNSLLSLIVKHKNNKVIVMCHGELEHIDNSKPLNPISNYFLKKLKSDSCCLSSNFHYCVLGESIFKNVCQSVKPHIAKQFLTFEHPFISSEVKNNSRKSKRIKIGTVGTMIEAKGYKSVCQLKELLKDCDIDIYLLGRMFIEQKDLDERDFKYIPGSQNEWVSKKTLNEYIDQMDYLFFLYPKDKYKFTASGALFDSINREKMILSLHNDYFDGIIEKMDIGYLFNDIKEMSLFIQTNMNMYKSSKNFRSAKSYFSPRNQSILFWKLLKDRGIV